MQSKEKSYVSEYNKKYRMQNKDKMKQKRDAYEACEHCGKMVQHNNKHKHVKSSYCKNHAIPKIEIEPKVEEPNVELNKIEGEIVELLILVFIEIP